MMRRLVLAALSAVALAGCITPSIPIPPPDPELMTFTVSSEDGTATFEYPATNNYREAIVFIYNRDLGVGVIEAAKPDGSVGPTAPLAARIDDQITVTFQREDQTVSRCIRLQDGAQSSTRYCD